VGPGQELKSWAILCGRLLTERKERGVPLQKKKKLARGTAVNRRKTHQKKEKKMRPQIERGGKEEREGQFKTKHTHKERL